MAAGVLDAGGAVPAAAYSGALTLSVLVTCLVAASGGLIFGYDIGISGGVSQMKPFLATFFPKVLMRMADAKRDQYCVFDSHALTGVHVVARRRRARGVAGRRPRHQVAGPARRDADGRGTVLRRRRHDRRRGERRHAHRRAGCSWGSASGSRTRPRQLYLAEMAPTSGFAGQLTVGFQFFLSLGILIANLTNYGTARVPWGWQHISLGLAGAPAVFIVVGAFFLTDTPSSFVMRGKVDRARAALLRVRGHRADVDAELKAIVHAVEAARGSEDVGAFRRLVTWREYRPHLTFALALPLCHQLSGMMVLTFFSPLVFRVAGFGSNAALMGAVILAGVKFASLILSTLVIDRYGRKVLVIAGAALMIVCQGI
ncbi:hypothetical protein OsI_06326 [Oryza sativa Indica Group]|uniref:Major facilitator superfamily (MFS) profile domain-containing protein n=1 Tax=Oryza sativa subsp. indica TaxID=39946 RepID=B8ADW6_ORYSI|nr:hypothetical protein OsI_06326 [Oryza sativa Indica Group]